MILVFERTSIDSPWLEKEPVRLGDVPPGIGTPYIYFLVESESKPLLRIDYYSYPEECYAFEETTHWKDWIVIGIGHKVYLVSLSDHRVKTIDLGNYFGHLYLIEDFLLIASAELLFCVDSNGNVIWKSDPLGIDGVIVGRFDEGIIYGEGEWDPPGGWRPFQIYLNSGLRASLSS